MVTLHGGWWCQIELQGTLSCIIFCSDLSSDLWLHSCTGMAWVFEAGRVGSDARQFGWFLWAMLFLSCLCLFLICYHIYECYRYFWRPSQVEYQRFLSWTQNNYATIMRVVSTLSLVTIEMIAAYIPEAIKEGFQPQPRSHEAFSPGIAKSCVCRGGTVPL